MINKSHSLSGRQYVSPSCDVLAFEAKSCYLVDSIASSTIGDYVDDTNTINL